MAMQSTGIPGSGYGNPYIDALAWGCGWDVSSGPIRYAFGSGYVPAADSTIGAFTGLAWMADEMAAFSQAIAQYEAVCNLTFAPASSIDAADADMVWWKATSASIGSETLGLHEVPDESWQPVYGYFNADYLGSAYGNLEVGSYSYITVIHELGHGLGLAHPHDGGSESDATKFPRVSSPWSMGSNNLNQGIWTTMSYIDGWNLQPSGSVQYGWQGTLMAFDIATLQALYGANMATATGNDVYVLPDDLASGSYWSSLWDAGGNDTISNAGSSLAAAINLNAAPLTGANAGGYVSWNKGVPGGYTIANGVVIENAIGGHGNDTLIGNSAANVLDGGAGSDTMNGGLGDDTYVVDSAYDKVTEVRNGGTDTVVASLSWTLAAQLENLTLLDAAGNARGMGNGLANVLIGNDFSNILSGGGGNDTLIGGGGVDILTGGRGADRFVFTATSDGGAGSTNRDIITDFKASQGDRVDFSALGSFSWIGTAAFAGNAYELRFQSGLLVADLDGDAAADFEIQLSGVSSLVAASLIL